MPYEEIETGQIIKVPLSSISLNPNQPRKTFEKQDLEELAQSIQAVGLIHPPSVRLIKKGRYELISGERRYQACKLAGFHEIPIYLKESNPGDSSLMALIENIQRVDLNPIEVAKALKKLIAESQLNQEDLASLIGKKRSTVSNYIRLLSLPSNIQASLLNNHITMGHAKAILSLEGNDKQNLLHEIILRDHLSVRDAEAAAIRINQKAQKKALVYRNADFFLDQLAEKVQHKLGTKVQIQGKGKGKGGKICIDYHNLNDLDRLLACFLGESYSID